MPRPRLSTIRVRRGVADAIFESNDVFAQGRWVSHMARRAAECGADWIINGDDDEFWFSSAGSLKGILGGRSPTAVRPSPLIVAISRLFSLRGTLVRGRNAFPRAAILQRIR